MKEAEELPINPLPAYPQGQSWGERTWLESEECMYIESMRVTKIKKRIQM